MIELLVNLFYSPDVDVINGLKMAAQVFLQTITMVTAALVVSGQLNLNYGEQICIQVSLVQNFLAVPEQIWSVVSLLILRKVGPPREPDFKTTEKELGVARDKAAVTFRQKLKACGTVLKCIKSMSPALKKGDPAVIITEIITRQKLLLSLEMLNSGGLNILFDDIFHCQSVRLALEGEVKARPEIAPPVLELLGNSWDTSVDFRDGVSNIYKIKNILEGLRVLETPQSLHKSEEAAMVSGLDFGQLLDSDTEYHDYHITETAQANYVPNIQGQDFLHNQKHWHGLNSATSCSPSDRPALTTDSELELDDYTLNLQPYTLYHQPIATSVSMPHFIPFASNSELVYYQPNSNPDDFAYLQFFKDDCTASHCDHQSSGTEHNYCGLGSFHGALSNGSSAVEISSSESVAVTGVVRTAARFVTVAGTDQDQLQAASEPAVFPVEEAGFEQELQVAGDKGLFKLLIERVVGACDADTLDELGEKLINILPEQLTSLIEEVPAGISTTASIMLLEMEEEEEKEESGRDSLVLVENEKKEIVSKSCMQKKNSHSSLVSLSSGQQSDQFWGDNSRLETTQKKKKPEIQRHLKTKVVAPAVQLICWLKWDWIFLWGSLFLALAALPSLLLTVLASTNCSCPQDIVPYFNSTNSSGIY